MNVPQFSLEKYNNMQSNKQKAGYLRYLANSLDAFDDYVAEQESKQQEVMRKHTHDWLFDKSNPSLVELRKKYLGEETVVEKDKNGKTVIIENGIIIGSQG